MANGIVVDIFGEQSEVEPEIEYSRKKYKLFDFLSDITQHKKNILRADSDAKRDYAPWIINRGLSMGIDTLLYANEINRCYGLDKGAQYDFYIHAIRPKRSFNKWPKDKKSDELKMVQEYYNVCRKHAEQYLEILTDEELKNIKQMMNKGGKI